MKRQILAAAFSSVLLAGCSSMPEISLPELGSPDPIVKNLMDKSSSYVLSKLGLPNQRKDSASGAMIWTYLDNEKGATAKACKVTLSIREDLVENVYISRSDKSLAALFSSACNRIRDDIVASR